MKYFTFISLKNTIDFYEDALNFYYQLGSVCLFFRSAISLQIPFTHSMANNSNMIGPLIGIYIG